MFYIPTERERERLYQKLKGKPILHPSESAQAQSHSPAEQMTTVEEVAQPLARELSHSQVEALLVRLTKETKKHYEMQQQVQNIKKSNLVSTCATQDLLVKRRNDKKVEERLLEWGRANNDAKEVVAKEQEQQMRRRYYRDIPKISEKAQCVTQKPIDKRVKQVIEERKAHAEQIKKKYQPSFQPTIDPYSEFLVEIENDKNFHNRMMTKKDEAGLRKSQLKQQLSKEREKQCTYQPIINDNSRRIAQQNANKTDRQAKPKSRDCFKQQFPFAPKINKYSAAMLQARPQGQPFHQRLFEQGKVYERRRKEKVQERCRAYSHQPTINRQSGRIVRANAHNQRQASNEDCQELFVRNPSCEPHRLSQKQSARSVVKVYSQPAVTDQQSCFSNKWRQYTSINQSK